LIEWGFPCGGKANVVALGLIEKKSREREDGVGNCAGFYLIDDVLKRGWMRQEPDCHRRWWQWRLAFSSVLPGAPCLVAAFGSLPTIP
jgi:hypothetical protein